MPSAWPSFTTRPIEPPYRRRQASRWLPDLWAFNFDTWKCEACRTSRARSLPWSESGQNELALKRRLPTMFAVREGVEAGGLVSYGINMTDFVGRSAAYVDKILKGTKAADLPIEQPTKFELIINMKTAKLLGLRVPRSLLTRADEVIQ